MARGGVPSGLAGRDPLSDVDSEVTQEASLTLSPAAAASRRSALRMPLQHSSAPLPSHRGMERLKMDYLYNPFTDLISSVDEPFQLPSEWQHAGIDAAVARSVSKVEAQANPDAQAALRKEWNIWRDIGTCDEEGVIEDSDVVAQLKGQTAHFGRLFAILVVKNLELPLGHKDRKKIKVG
eukprot:9473678-Pyramimonas_sp.AAC.2